MNGYDFKANTGIIHLVNITNSYGIGLKIGDESIVLHNSIVLPTLAYPFPFCIKDSPIYIGKALLNQPYNLYNIRYVFEIFKNTFKNTDFNRQNAINPNILFNNNTNYNTISFKPKTIDEIELYPIADENSIYNNQITEYLVNKKLINNYVEQFELGTILIDNNEAAKIYATTNFKQDINNEYAFTHNFHRDTVNDNFYIKSETDIKSYQYGIVFKRIIMVIIQIISDYIIFFIDSLSLIRLLNYISDSLLYFYGILYFIYGIREYLYPQIHKDIASKRAFTTDYTLIEEKSILKPKQLSYEIVIKTFLITLRSGFNNTYNDILNNFTYPLIDINKMSVGEYLRYYLLFIAENNEDYTKFNFGKEYIEIINFYKKKDESLIKLLNNLNNSDLIINSTYNKDLFIDNFNSRFIIEPYTIYILHLGYGHLFFSILLSNANNINKSKSIFGSLLNNLSGDIIPITFGHGIIDVINRTKFFPFSDTLCDKFLSKEFIFKLMEKDYEVIFYNLSNKIGNLYTFMYDAYIIVKNTVNSILSSEDILILNKSILSKDNLDWKKAYTNAIFFGTVIHNIAHYLNNILSRQNSSIFYRIISNGLINQIKSNKTKYINCSLIQKEMICKLKKKYPNYIDYYGYIFISPHTL
jgi:hypothetical protein